MYVPVNIKTDYELGRSLIKIDDLISYALKSNISSLGITDSNMFGTYEFVIKCNKNNIKPIIGIEIDLEDKNFYLYAKNYDGLINLFKIVSNKNINEIDISFIKKHSDNLICVCNYFDYDYFDSLFDFVFIGYNNLSEKKNALVITNNVVFNNKICYFNKSDNYYYKYFLQISKIEYKDEYDNLYFVNKYDNNDEENTKKFASLIDIVFPEVKMHIPVYSKDSTKFLRALSKKGLEKRLDGNVPQIYKDRLKYELSVIEKMNFVDYFLIVYDYILYAKKNNIMVGPGRGSGAGSLVNYSLGIIDIDPIKYNLIFERFLNPARVTMPDIDVDFDDDKKKYVIDYVINKYDEDKVARIISFNTYGPKAIIRSIAPLFNVDKILIDNLSKTIGKEKDFKELEGNFKFCSIVKRHEILPEVMKVCNKLCNLKKDSSITAAGVVISDVPLDNIIPLYKSNNQILTGYSKEFIEPQGLLKMDFLSVTNLKDLSNIVDDIKNDYKDFNINKIPLDDSKTFDVFKNVYTNGIFQFNTYGMKKFLRELNTNNFKTLMEAIALFRPGAMNMIPEYIARHNGKKEIKYDAPILEEILSDTYGIIIYQEQVLDIFKKVANFTYGEADNIRRAMSKKDVKIIEGVKPTFIKNCLSNGYSEEFALNLFDKLIKFAGYGFNKSHSVAYSDISYKMAYLKANYSIYFMKNFLNNSISSSNLKEYIDEAKYFSVGFENIDINKSDSTFIINDDKLVVPFTLIKNIDNRISEFICTEREKKLFKNFYDFMIRCYGDIVSKNVVISLIECNAFNINKKMYIDNIDEIINYVNLCRELDTVLDNPSFDNIEDYNDTENIQNEIKNFGFYLSNHPVTKYDRTSYITLKDYQKYFDRNIKCILYIESMRGIKTKDGEKMLFVNLSDEYGKVDGVIFPSVYSKYKDIENNNIYKFICNVEKRKNNYQLIINNIEKV